MHEMQMQQKMCPSEPVYVCVCSAHIHALTAYKQQYRFNYRGPSSCLLLCLSVLVHSLYVFLCKCVSMCCCGNGETVSVVEYPAVTTLEYIYIHVQQLRDLVAGRRAFILMCGYLFNYVKVGPVCVLLCK